MPTLKRSELLIYMIPFIAFVVYSLIWHDISTIHGDTASYQIVAQDLRDGTLEQLHDRTPGYPLFMLLTGSSEQPGQALFLTQLLMYCLSTVALSWLMIRTKLSKPLIFLFQTMALLPMNVAITTAALTEALTSFLLVSGFVSAILWLDLEKKRYLVIAGLAFAYAAVSRPTYQMLFLLFVILFLTVYPFLATLKQQMAKLVAAITAGTIAMVGTLIFVNVTQFGFFGTTPLLGFNLSTKTVRVIERLPDTPYRDIKEVLIESRDHHLTAENGSHSALMYIWSALPELKKRTGMEMAELSRHMTRINLHLIVHAPYFYLKEVGYSVIRYWFPNTTCSASYLDSNLLRIIFVLCHFLIILSFFALSLFGMMLVILSALLKPACRLISREDEAALITILIPLTIILYTMLISTMFEIGNARYRTPTDLLIFFTTVYLFHFIRSKIAVLNERVD